MNAATFRRANEKGSSESSCLFVFRLAALRCAIQRASDARSQRGFTVNA